MNELLNKYRPQTWDDVLGHTEQVAALREGLSRHKTFLFSGPAGVGKTTLARLVANEIGATQAGRVKEIDATAISGVDEMRALLELVLQPQLSPSPLCLIIDEAHDLSAKSRETLLKPSEEPPEHLYICLCTTEVTKIPETIKSRCLHIALKPLPADLIISYLEAVAQAENWIVDQDKITAIAQAANGSPRQALNYLSAVAASNSIDVIAGATAIDVVAALAKRLGRDGRIEWPSYAKLLKSTLDAGESSESAVQVGRYLIGMLLNAKDAKNAGHIAEMIATLARIGNDRVGEAIATMALVYLDQ